MTGSKSERPKHRGQISTASHDLIHSLPLRGLDEGSLSQIDVGGTAVLQSCLVEHIRMPASSADSGLPD